MGKEGDEPDSPIRSFVLNSTESGEDEDFDKDDGNDSADD